METDFKQITKNTYNAIAEDYVQRDQRAIAETAEVRAALNLFISLISEGEAILDIGAGGGRDTRFFHAQGFSVVGIDFSEKLIELARQQNGDIKYVPMDIEDLKFPPESFEAAWANASLLHLPKASIPAVLKKIRNVLKPKGILFVKVKKGDGENLVDEQKFGKNVQRFFSFYQIDELLDLLREAGFSIIHHELTTADKWIDVYARK